MTLSLPSIVGALLGGALIGISATLMLVFAGRIAGISGILGGVLVPRTGDVGWRVAFLGGLGVGALLLALVAPGTVSASSPSPLWLVVVAGLLVGVGTQLGSGCTSGHGVCGVSRLAPRSLAATAMFMATGAAAAFVTRHLLGLGS